MDSSNPNTATYLQLLKLYAKTVFFYCQACLPRSKHHSCTETDDAAHSQVLILVIKKILPVVQDFTEIKHSLQLEIPTS